MIILYIRYIAIIDLTKNGIRLNNNRSIKSEIIISIKENKSFPKLKKIIPLTKATLKPVNTYPNER